MIVITGIANLMQALVLIDYNKTNNRGLISLGWLHISGNVKIAINYFYLFKKVILTFHIGTQLHLLQEVNYSIRSSKYILDLS